MRKIYLGVVFGMLLGCTHKPDTETEELYNVYIDQYHSLKGHASMKLYEWIMLYKDDMEYANHLRNIQSYMEKNDSLLNTTTHTSNPLNIDSIHYEYNTLLKSIAKKEACRDIALYYFKPFPFISGHESKTEIELKIRESNLNLAEAHFIAIAKSWGKYPFKSGGTLHNPAPELVSVFQKGDSVYYSFLYGICGLYRHQESLAPDSVMFNNKPYGVQNLHIYKGNHHHIIQLKTEAYGKYGWKIHDTITGYYGKSVQHTSYTMHIP